MTPHDTETIRSLKAELTATQAELAKAMAYTEVLDKSWCEIADRHLAERTAARNALSALRARVVEVGTLGAGMNNGAGELSTAQIIELLESEYTKVMVQSDFRPLMFTGALKLIRALSNLVKEAGGATDV